MQNQGMVDLHGDSGAPRSLMLLMALAGINQTSAFRFDPAKGQKPKRRQRSGNSGLRWTAKEEKNEMTVAVRWQSHQQ